MDKLRSHPFNAHPEYPQRCLACPFGALNPIHRVATPGKWLRGVIIPDKRG